MSPLKWINIVLFAAAIFNGIAAKSVEETKPSSAKECRQHIEKALEQYWDEKGTNDVRSSITNENRDQTNKKDDDEDDERKSINRKRGNSGEQQQELADQDDEDEDTEDNDEINYRADADTDDDDDDEDDDENENSDDEDDDEEDEDDDEDEDDTEDATEQGNKNVRNTLESESANDDESDDEGETRNENDDDDDEEDDEDDEEDDEDDDEEENSLDETERETTDLKDGDGAEEEDDDDEEDDEDDENGDDDDDDDDNDEEEDIEEEKTNNLIKNETSKTDIPSKVTPNKTSEVTGEVNPPPTEAETRVSEASREPLTQVEESLPNITYSKDKYQKDSERSDQDETEEDESDSESTDENDDTIENIYEEEDAEPASVLSFRSKDHIDVILGLNELEPEYEKEAEKLAQSIFKDIKKIETTSIKPIEMLYKYAESTTQVLTDAEIFSKPMILFLGPWNAGKTSVINYILGLENTPTALKTGTGITDVDFTVLTHGDRHRVVSGTELATDWRYAGLQKFGQGFLDHFRSIYVQHALLKKVTIIDTPGILENRKITERGYSFNDAFQWFIDRADVIYVVLDPTKVDIGAELGSIIEELKGQEVRFILNKADTIRRSDLMKVVGQLFWNLSPLLSTAEAPIIYAVSLSSRPFHPSAPAKFLVDQEKNLLYDIKDILDQRIENRILYTRKHGVRVRNHAKMVDCYLASYYRHKSIFSNKRNVAKLITENPREYNIYDGMSGMTNVSRYDMPNPHRYKEFFKVHPLYDFKPLASTCSYFRGCPMEKLDLAVAKEIPELLAKYKKAKRELSGMLQHER